MVVASRIVTVSDNKKPKVYLHDPVLEGDEMNDNNLPGLINWTARSSVYESLIGLGHYRLALKGKGRHDEPIELPVFRCILPGMENYQFVGKFSYPPRFLPFSEWIWLNHNRGNTYFEGLEYGIVLQAINNNVMQGISETPDLPFGYFFRDGNLIMPWDLMEYVKLRAL
jgi:hypothetical protein